MTSDPTYEPDAPLRTRDTGRRVPHPRTCGGCNGNGCPIVELVVTPWEDVPDDQ